MRTVSLKDFVDSLSRQLLTRAPYHDAATAEAMTEVAHAVVKAWKDMKNDGSDRDTGDSLQRDNPRLEDSTRERQSVFGVGADTALRGHRGDRS